MSKTKDAYLEALKVFKDPELAAKAAKIQPDTVRQYRARDAEFKNKIDLIRSSFGEDLYDGKFPEDFLDYRRLSCAYRDHRSKLYVRAVNNWYQKDAYARLQEHNRLVVVLPPGHIKTTFFCIEYPTWKIMGDRNVRVVAVQKNQEEAKKLVAAVSERLTDSDYYDFMNMQLAAQGDEQIVNPLKAWFNHKPFRPVKRGAGDTWGAQQFKVIGRTSGEKDNTMEAKGVGGQIQGVRADLILLDDIQDPAQAVRSVSDSDDKLRWFKDVILGRVTEAQQVVVLANYFAPDDFAHKLIAANPEFAVVEYPAIVEGENGPEPLCPEFWTMDALEFKKREVGEQTWYYTWMQEVGSYENATFKRELVEAAKNPEAMIGEVPHSVTDVFLGVDPAIAASGYCAMVLWGLDRRTKQRWLIDVFNQSGMRTWDTVIAQITAYAQGYPLRKVIIERNNTQGSLAFNPALDRALRSVGTRIETYQTVTGTGGRAEITNFDITTIGGLFDSGLVSICYGGTYEQTQRIDAYIDQLVAWRTNAEGHSIKHLVRDMVMATLFAESEAFALANRPPKILTQDRSRVPDWAKNSDGQGFAWQRTRAMVP